MEVFEECFSKISKIKKAKEINAYTRAMARYKCWAKNRKDKFEFDMARVSLQKYKPLLTSKIPSAETSLLLKNINLMISKLPEHERQVIELYYYQDLSVRKIAKRMNSTEFIVRVYLRNAIRYLRLVIEGKLSE
jgi:RNA polymerase sigma factor (sigma-70 family)